MRDSSKRIHDDANPQQEPLPTGPKAATKQRPALALLREALTELHITGTCRSVAYELMTYWSPGGTVFPAVQTLADDMGLNGASFSTRSRPLNVSGSGSENGEPVRQISTNCTYQGMHKRVS